MVINANEASEPTSLKADSIIDIVFSRITKVTNKIVSTVASMIIALEGGRVARVDHRVTTTIDAREQPNDCAKVIDN